MAIPSFLVYYGNMPIPPYSELSKYVLKALYQKGGTASVKKVESMVADMLKLTPRERAEMHANGKTRLSHRIAWARFDLKKKGFLESSKRGFSVLSKKGRSVLGL
jgi:restriction system protein